MSTSLRAEAPRVLLVDDEPLLTELLSIALTTEGWTACSAADGLGAVAAATRFRPDVVVLDMMLPDIDGLEVLRRLRHRFPAVPVLFLTAKDGVEDRVRALTEGGDDYVTKPFSLAELIARLRTLLRRADPERFRPSESAIVIGDLSLDEQTRQVFRGSDPITLTATEFELLRYLMENPQRVLSKGQILDRVWNYSAGTSNLVEIYVSYLRKKVDAGRPPMIRTVGGIGYLLDVPDPPASVPAGGG